MKKTKKSSILRLTLVVLSAILLLGMLSVASFATDVAEVRYQIDGGDWTEATFADAITAVAGETATIELQKDVTLATTGVTITGGDLIIQSKGDAIYTVTRGGASNNASTDKPCFTLNGAKVTFKNITLDGKNSVSARINGAMISLTTAEDTVVLDSGATIQKSKANANRGGAIYAPAGTVEMKPGSVIRECEAMKGGAIALGDENAKTGATFNMTGGLITECRTHANNGSANGSVLYMAYYSTFNMSSGLITKNYSGRNAVSTGLVGAMIDGAVVSNRNKDATTRNIINVSGDAIIRDNYGLKITDSGTASTDYVLGADVVYTVGDLNTQPYTLVIAKDFAGSVGLAYSTSPASVASMTVDVATAAEGAYAYGAVVPRLIDNLSTRVAKLNDASYLMRWADAVAEVDYEGKITRYATLAEAYAFIGDKAPIKLLADVSDVDLSLETGESVRLDLNDHSVSFAEGAYYNTTKVTETVGAYTYGTYTYAGVDAEVTTYTMAETEHVCAPGTAGEDAPSACVCGKLFAFPTDESKTVRYSIDGGVTWTYTDFASALTAVSGETVIVELYRDVTLSAGVAVSSALIIRSLPAELNGVDGDKIYSINRGDTFAQSVFTVSGSANLTFKNITLDGQSKSAAVDGAMISLTSANATVVFDNGTTVQNSVSSKNGGMLNATAGNIVINDGAKILNNIGVKGAAFQLTGTTFTMNGGLIKGNSTTTSGTSHGGAIYMTGTSKLYLKGGEITENTSNRTFEMKKNDVVTQGNNSFIDGAIGFIGTTNYIYLSGDAKVHGNYGRWYEGDKAASTSTVGADIVPCANYRYTNTITIEAGFTGHVGIANAETAQIAVAATTYAVGTVIEGIFDCNDPYNVAKITASGKVGWALGEAEVDTGDGSPKVYGTLAAALTAAGKADKATVTLLQDVTLTAGVTVKGDVTLTSADGSTYSINRGANFATSMIAVDGKLTLTNITVDGKDVYLDSRINGSMISLSKVTDEIVLGSGATLQNSIRANYGGAIFAPYGRVTLKEGSLIRNCEAAKGGAVYLGNTATAKSATLNMTGGMITECVVPTGYTSGAAIFMEGYATFNMSGGLITENQSGRNGSDPKAHTVGTLVDGAVALWRNTNVINLSGEAIIRGNKGYRVEYAEDGETHQFSKEYHYGADIVFTVNYGVPSMINVSKDFTGSVGLANPFTGPNTASRSRAIATATSYAFGDVIPGLLDANSNRLASVMTDLLTCWDVAEAEVDYNGKITRYATLADAYAAVGDKAAIKLLANVTNADLFLWKDQSIQLILGSYTISFTEGTECSATTATEKVGAFTYESYTYEGVDAEVTTYTATKVTHVCTTEGATENTPVFCACGKLSAFPTDEAKNVRYSTDGGETWVYATFADALAVASETAKIIELYRDVTLTAGLTVSGDVTIRSFPAELNGVDGEKIYTILRGTEFTTSMFTISGGKLTFADITVDGNGKNVTATAAGAVVNFAATAVTTDTLTLDSGATIQNSYAAKLNGGAIYAACGNIVINDGATIRDCHGGKGGAIYSGSRDITGAATVTMNGGIITECSAAADVNTGHGAAIYMSGNVTFTMKGGVIAGNTSYRTYVDSTKQEADILIDGAIGNIYNTNKIYLSGNATIRNNYGMVYQGSETPVIGADIVFYAAYRDVGVLNIAADFTGSVGISFPTTGNFANVATDYEVGTVLGTVIDANNGNVAKVTTRGKLQWAAAEAELDLNGKVTRFETVDEAYEIAGSETPIKLVNNATITKLKIGDTAQIIENGYSLTVQSEGSFEKSEGVTATVGAFTVGDVSLPGYEVTVVTYTIIEGGSISSVALSAGTDLSLYFYANMGSKFADSVLRVTRGSNTTELTSTYDEALGLYRFVYSDIAPQCAGDAISVELVNGEDVLFTYDNYSILSYCQQVLAMDADSLGLEEEKCEELKTLLRDLLTYCASAQTYLGYNTDALVNEGIKGSTFVLPAYTPKSIAVHNKVEGVTFTLAGLRFYNVNNLWFEFTTTDPAKTTVDINGKIYTSDSFVLQSGNTYRVYAEDLYAIQFDQAFVAKLSFDGTLLQTLHYSVGAYVHSLVTAEEGEYTEAAINLAKATYNYGVAARIWADRYAATTHTAGTLVSTHGANTLGGAAIENGVLAMDQPASGIEFAFRGKGDVVLNLTAEEAARIEVMVDGQVLPHFLVSAGTADYTVKTGLADGKHTVRIVQENGAVTLNSANVKGYFTAPEAQTKDLFIEFVGSDALLGHNLFLNYSSYEDDATGAYAVLAARELGARYLISDTDKVFAATADAPDLVVIDFENGFDYTDLLADIRAAYGAGVEILFVGCVEQISAMDESFINLTKDTSGIDEYPSAGGAAIQGAELAKYIRESYDFFTADEIAEAKKDIIVEVTSTNATSGYNPFYVYIRTSDPSGKYYIRYNFTHQYDTNRTNYGGSTTTNISNFRILGAHLVEVTDVNENAVTCNPVLYVLGPGEISTALKTMSNTNGTTSGDFTGGLHGDEWIRGVDGTDGHLTDEGWIPAVALLADGVEIDIVGGEAKVITCNTLTFDQTTMMYEWGTSSDAPTNDIEKRGTPLVIHTQHFTITRESGIQNRQSYTWLKDVGIDTSSNYLLMFTMNRFDGTKDVCTEMEVFNTDCVSNGTASAFGKLDVSSISVLHNATSRFIHYGGDVGVTSYARYDLCNVGKFSDNSVTLQDIWVSIRNGTASADNKLYVRFKSSVGEEDEVAAGDFWTLDVAYGIDYVNPNN